jgi:hypothetical protein
MLKKIMEIKKNLDQIEYKINQNLIRLNECDEILKDQRKKLLELEKSAK